MIHFPAPFHRSLFNSRWNHPNSVHPDKRYGRSSRCTSVRLSFSFLVLIFFQGKEYPASGCWSPKGKSLFFCLSFQLLIIIKQDSEWSVSKECPASGSWYPKGKPLMFCFSFLLFNAFIQVSERSVSKGDIGVGIEVGKEYTSTSFYIVLCAR